MTGGAGTLGFEASKALLEHGLSGLMIFDLNPVQAEPKIEELRNGKLLEDRAPIPRFIRMPGDKNITFLQEHYP